MNTTVFGERVLRNPFRVRKRSRRTAPHAADSMTPQGQAVWASRNIDNAFGFIGPVFKKQEKKLSMDDANELLHALDGKIIKGANGTEALIKGNTIYFKE